MLEERENATWRSVNGMCDVATPLLHLRPRTSCVLRSLSLLLFTRLASTPLFLNLLPRTHLNPWPPSTPPTETSHHHHHHTLHRPPHHLFRRRLPPNLQQNLVLRPHPMKTLPCLESGHGRTLHLRSARRPAPTAIASQPRTAVTSARHSSLPSKLA